MASILDPLGILSPSTIRLKIKLQDSWKDNASWDDPIPNTILNSWEEFASQAELLKSIEIPSFLKGHMKVDSRMEMHGYCDGSGNASSAVVYIRIIPLKKDDGKVVVVFVVAKTRVNPIEPVTLPRIVMFSTFVSAFECIYFGNFANTN
ncbi:hypothetical protein AVEN_8428-1 [Araneus ventricosus]|uniref:Uncharacterized protein n=1 Tax=Araneus ventricosus TaxID=182803 RepID=A0A4Y2IE26_ARAVE|nr:hypothetical protein AVEN_8428-1 [Araneus ventricosus]